MRTYLVRKIYWDDENGQFVTKVVPPTKTAQNRLDHPQNLLVITPAQRSKCNILWNAHSYASS